ncbi:hypothetical protein [Candidatus Leptofilum sp.]|uniref:hypothetical protein n=1 Tax=Candidatus Leptofilum sp. TaxID=3241576 RepID=UPI003B590001
MTLIDAISVISLVVGATSIILAVFAMNSAKRSEEKSLENFNNTQAMMRDFYDRTKDLLNEIDKRASTTEAIVKDSQEKLLTTITEIVSETILPQKEDLGEKLGLMLMQQMVSDPDAATRTLNALMPFAELGQQVTSNDNKNEPKQIKKPSPQKK